MYRFFSDETVSTVSSAGATRASDYIHIDSDGAGSSGAPPGFSTVGASTEPGMRCFFKKNYGKFTTWKNLKW